MSTAARSADAAAAERAGFVRYLRAGRRAAALEPKFNGNHDPKTGRFAAADGTSGEAQREFQQTSLGLLDKATAKAMCAANTGHLADNIKRQFERIGGRSFTPAQLHSILSDVLNGPSTSVSGLMLFSDPNISRFNAAQVRVINTYVAELPNTPLNNSVTAGWKSYMDRIGGTK